MTTTIRPRLLSAPVADPADAAAHYAKKLSFETDCSDVHDAAGAAGFVVVDSRSPEAFAKGHVPGAVSFPYATTSPETTAGWDREALGHLGPDVLADDFDHDEAVRRLLQEPTREVGLALLDQRNLAGLGNLYRTEALFLHGVTPWTAVADVDLDRLVTRAVRLISANRGHWQQSTTGSLRPGEDHWVFERSGKPCRRCGQRVLMAEQGEAPYQRLTYWCGHCQVGRAPVPRLRRPTRPQGRARYTP